MNDLNYLRQEIKTTNILINQTKRQIKTNESIMRLYLMEMESLASELNYLRFIKNSSFLEIIEKGDTINTKISKIENRFFNEATDNKTIKNEIKRDKQFLNTLELNRKALIKNYIDLFNNHDGANVDKTFNLKELLE